MRTPDDRSRGARPSAMAQRRTTIRRAFAEFLFVPTTIIIAFLLLAGGMYALERADLGWLQPLRSVLRSHVFNDTESTADLLGTIAGSLITVASITISLLLLALQQTAGSLTSEVFDQFLRRRHNQFYFGFFVGLALYALVTLATVNDPFNPVLAASIAFLFTIVALFLLIVLLYTAMNQMRPAEIVAEIHRHTLAARTRQLELVRRTRRTPQHVRPGDGSTPVSAAWYGYVTGVDLDVLARAIAGAHGAVEIVLRVSIGSFVSSGDRLADVSCADRQDVEPLVSATHRALRLERQRDIITDPAHGIDELTTIAWTSISTAKSNPAPGLHAIRVLRDLLARWAEEEQQPASPDAESSARLPVVYTDTVITRLMDAFESLAVISTESMQHQAYAEVARTFAVLFDRLPVAWRPRAEDVVLRMLSGLGDHVLTAELEGALAELAQALAAVSLQQTGAAVERARVRLARSIGELNSRATRVAS